MHPSRQADGPQRSFGGISRLRHDNPGEFAVKCIQAGRLIGLKGSFGEILQRDHDNTGEFAAKCIQEGRLSDHWE
jgi:hypothetical protein